MDYDVIIIGGGPAGMFTAIQAAEQYRQQGKRRKILLIEQNEKLGKKLYITGKGRCNLTNATEVEHHLNQMTTNHKFMYSALYSYDSVQVIDFFERHRLKTKIERGNRVFPASDRSSQVIKTLVQSLTELGIEVKLREKGIDIEAEAGKVVGVSTDKGRYQSPKIVIATGGISYPMTGSTGDGYRWAKQLRHQLVPPIPGLVPLLSSDTAILQLQGLSLKNTGLQLIEIQKNTETILYQDQGELMFTHFGLTGPLVLSAASSIPRTADYRRLQIRLDLKPGLTEEKLDARLLRDFAEASNKNIKNGLHQLLPSRLLPVVLAKAQIAEEQVIHSVTKQQRQRLVSVLKHFPISITGTAGFDQAIITRGGVSTNQINPHTMESTLIQGLYFVGEVIDIDSLTGGFNLQLAFSTANLCAMALADPTEAIEVT